MVLDWDGTATERDTLHMAITRFGDRELFDALEEEVGERMTLDEVIAAEMATIRAPLGEVVAWLVEHVRVRPGFHELVQAHDPLIVSAGFHELIEPILAREGVDRPRRRKPHRGRPDRLAQRVSRRADLLRLRRALQAVGHRRPSARSRTRATACPTVACRFGPTAGSRRDGLAAWLDEQGVDYETVRRSARRARSTLVVGRRPGGSSGEMTGDGRGG